VWPALSGIRFAVQVYAELAAGIPGDGDMSPCAGLLRAAGNDGVVDIAAHVDAETAVKEVEIRCVLSAQQAVRICQGRLQSHPRLDRERSLQFDAGAGEAAVLPVERKNVAEQGRMGIEERGQGRMP